MTEFINESQYKFDDIGTELYREYEFVDKGVRSVVRIDLPLKLSVSPNGHRVFDAQGVSHYVPKGWIHLSWKVAEGRPNFVK